MKDVGVELAKIAAWFVCIIIAGNILISKCDRHNYITPPVEEIVVDSLKQVNDTIKVQITQLDSIKDAEIIKVKKLSNDSTLELFYKLIRE